MEGVRQQGQAAGEDPADHLAGCDGEVEEGAPEEPAVEVFGGVLVGHEVFSARGVLLQRYFRRSPLSTSTSTRSFAGTVWKERTTSGSWKDSKAWEVFSGMT